MQRIKQIDPNFGFPTKNDKVTQKPLASGKAARNKHRKQYKMPNK